MKRILSLLSLGAVCAALASTAPASAALWTTAGAPSSSLTISIILGDPTAPGAFESKDGGADGGYIILSSLGPQAVTGTADADVSLAGGDGSLTFNSAALGIADGTLNVDLSGLLGGDPGSALLDASLSGVGLSITSTPIPVTANAWNLDLAPPTSFSLLLNQGSLVLTSPTGLLAILGEPDPTVIDLSTDPVTVSLADLSGFNIGGTASSALINTTIPAAYVDLGASLLGAPDALFLSIGGSINVVPIPEPSSVVLLGLGLAGLAAYGYRRRK